MGRKRDPRLKNLSQGQQLTEGEVKQRIETETPLWAIYTTFSHKIMTDEACFAGKIGYEVSGGIPLTTDASFRPRRISYRNIF